MNLRKHFGQIYHGSTLRTKISVLVSGAMLITMLLSQIAIYRQIATLVRRQAQQTADITLSQLETTAEDQLRSLVERLYFIRYDITFEDTLSDYLLGEDSGSAYGVATTQLSGSLSLHKVSEPLIDSLYLYTNKGSFTDIGPTAVIGFDLKESALWPQLEASGTTITWGTPYTDEIFLSHRQVVPLMYRFTIDGYGNSCILLANIDRAKLTRELGEMLSEDNCFLFIVDEAGNLITDTSGDAALLAHQPETLSSILNSGSDLTQITYGEHPYLVGQRELGIASWRIVYLQSEAHYYELLERIGLVFLLINMLLIVVVLALIMRIARSVTAPISRLSDCMHADEPQPFDYPYHNEIGRLTASYNDLLAHNASLLKEKESYILQLRDEKDQLRIEQQLKRRAELKALQAQINPHFLYNTLDSIHWKAEIAGVPDISQMTLALATLFRIGLSRGHEIISLEQELRYVDSYLQIQKFRYGDRLNYRVDLPKELLTLHTVKLILQPLVENAIYHGIKENDAPGIITVTGRREGDVLILQVIDDGLGIPPPRLQMLQEDLKRGLIVSNDGYGIFNVNERIRLYFGPDYGLTLESTFEQGTTATVRMPCIDDKEAERYVSLTDS